MKKILQRVKEFLNPVIQFCDPAIQFIKRAWNTKVSKTKYAIAVAWAIAITLPHIASATNAITEFSGPLERVVGTLTGPAGMWISILAMALCGVYYVMNKDDITGTFKQVLSTVFAITCIASAATIVNNVFSFSGAVV